MTFILHDQYDSLLSRLVATAAARGFAPFYTGEITLWTHPTDFLNRTVRFSVQLRNCKDEAVIDILEKDLYDLNRVDSAAHIAHQAFLFFRYKRTYIEPDNHIVLGEN